MSEFFAMGGYAAFVWPAYGVAAGALILLIALSVRAQARARRALARLEGGAK